MIHKALWAALAIAIVTGCSKSTSTVTDTRGLKMNYTETFKLQPTDRVLVEAYGKLSDPWTNVAPQKVAELTDAETIGKIVTLVSALPNEGQIMKKMSEETPLLRTTFFYPQDTVYFEYYAETIKTPATSFYGEHPAEEKQLYDLLKETLK